MRWHCSPDHRLTLYIDILCSRSEAELATIRSRMLPTILIHCEWAEKKHFVSLKLECQSRFRIRNLSISKQAVLTTAPGSPPYRPYSISSGNWSIFWEAQNYIGYLFNFRVKWEKKSFLTERSRRMCNTHFNGIYSIVLVIQGHFQGHLQGHKMSISR